MESESLISITLSTKTGIDIYSSKVIDQYNFYLQTLKESGIDIIFRYDNGEQDIYNINDLLEYMNVSSDDNIHYFNELYGKEFNSSSKFKIFELIDIAYNQKYGYTIRDSPVFQKYNELFRKIKIIERQSSDIWKQLNPRSRTKIAQLPFSDKLDECYNLLVEPHKNDSKIIENLEFIISGYRKIVNEEKEENKKEEEEKKRQEEKELRRDLTIRKNQFGQFVYEKYNMVYDPLKKCIIGTSNKMGGVYPLDYPGVKLCNQLKLKYIVVNDQRQ
jgi:hypothetical protein